MYQEIHFTDGREKIIVSHSLSYMQCLFRFGDWSCGKDDGCVMTEINGGI